uniref:Uncharacterized protein n=1 Tax=Salix viminalis TaxID=40686 RepID=A0A6N2N6J2_SALVM
MGTREVYEQKLRTGNLYHDPTIKPGLGSPRCPRCLSLLNPIFAKGEWAITSVLHDVAGSGIGGLLSAVHGFNTGIPFLQNRLKGPKWLPFLVGVHPLPPLLAVSVASAVFGGYTLNKDSIAQFGSDFEKSHSYNNFLKMKTSL